MVGHHESVGKQPRTDQLQSGPGRQQVYFQIKLPTYFSQIVMPKSSVKATNDADLGKLLLPSFIHD